MTVLLTALAALAVPAASEATVGDAESIVEDARVDPNARTFSENANSGLSSIPPPPVCTFSRYGYTGRYYCGTHIASHNWGSGNTEYFLLGTDWSVWHIWRGSGGWKKLGGNAYRSTGNGVWVAQTSPELGITTLGTDERWWCKYRGNGNWHGSWLRC